MSRKQHSQRPERVARARRTKPKHQESAKEHGKPKAAVVCDDCGLVFHAGRWFEGAPPLTDVNTGVCPACERIRRGVPAGELRVPAGFVETRDELIGMIENAEKAESADHPLERLMGIVDDPDSDGLLVRTTGIHLARRIANKLERRFHRQARFDYADGRESLRVDWPEA